MGKKQKVILPPLLPPDIREEDVEVSEEDLEFVKSNKKYAGFLQNLDTKSIDRHVARIAITKEDALEALYEKRNRKAYLQESSQENDLLVDPVDALPIKTLDGQLEYRRAKESRSSITSKDNEAEEGEEIDDSVEKSTVKLTKAERRQKLKKARKEAKKQAKVESVVVMDENSHAEVLADVEKDLSAEQIFVKKKNKLAEIGDYLHKDPETNIKFLKELMQFCNDSNRNIVKLALLSSLAVFRDLIPGYRIRLPTEKELEMNVSKAIKKRRFNESTLLHSYKAYLLRLIALERKPFFCHLAVRCMCNLLKAVPHFNFRDSLLSSVVENISSPDDTIRNLCCSAIRSVFTDKSKDGGEATVEAVNLITNHVKIHNYQLHPDSIEVDSLLEDGGEATVEAVNLITNRVKIHNYQLHPDSIEVFLSLTFDDDIGKSKAVDKRNNNKTKKRRWKQINEDQRDNERKLSKKEMEAKTRDEVLQDIKATSFSVDSEERRTMQTETLSSIFETYFRILKHTMELNVSRSTSVGIEGHPLLAPCLKGLAKFSHLLDLDFMSDLMGCLKKLADSGGVLDVSSSGIILSVSERMQCCIVAFKVMRNNLDALNVDLQDFFVHLYNLLLEYRPHRDQGEVLAEALKIMLCDGKQHDMQRAAAFIKRLATFSLCFGAAEAMAALVTLKHLLQKNSKCRSLLENDAGGGSLSGLVVKYQPDAVDPNLSGALASVLWELSLLTKHYHPTILSIASSISSMSTAQSQVYIPVTSPQQAFSDLSIERASFELIGKPKFNLKKRRMTVYGSLCSTHHLAEEMQMDEDDLRSKFENHFTVVKNISESERLRAELNQTLASISLYEEYKKQKKRKGGNS